MTAMGRQETFTLTEAAAEIGFERMSMSNDIQATKHTADCIRSFYENSLREVFIVETLKQCPRNSCSSRSDLLAQW